MLKRHAEFLTMVNGVVAHFDKNLAVYDQEPLVKEAYAHLIALHVKVKAILPVQTLATTGHTARKDDLLETMLEQSFKMARNLALFARKQNDAVLLSIADHSRSSLEKGLEVTTLNRCERIAEKAQELVAQLAPYKVDQAKVDLLKKAIDAYRTAPADRDQATGLRQTATAGIRELVASLRDALAELDDLVFTQIEGNEEFVATYRHLRKIGGRSSKAVPVEANVV